MKKTKLDEKLAVKKTKLRVNTETLQALDAKQLEAVAGGRGNTGWCSVGQFVGGCR